jgi:hypothetical protein
MKKIKSLLLIISVSLVAGGLNAGSFEKDVKSAQGKVKAGPAPEPTLAQAVTGQDGTKWWSVNFFGSAHRAIIKASLKQIDGNTYPDISAAKDDLKEGSNDESGHPNDTMDGGDVKGLWAGVEGWTKGGVLQNYGNFNFHQAYERLGTICHLTQDQSVPTHVANIKHGISDSFEGFYDNTVKIPSIRYAADLEPYAYYQVLQDETRVKLPGWTDPETNLPYWVAAPDAPALGQDSTFGPRGHYGGRKNRDRYAVPPQNNFSDGNNDNTWTSAHPEIRLQQLTAAGEATIRVLQSASKRLPPLVKDLSVSSTTADRGNSVALLHFTALDNRSARLAYAVNIYRDGVLLGVGAAGEFPLEVRDDTGIMRKEEVSTAWTGSLEGSRLPAGNYTLELRLTDTDGNTNPYAAGARVDFALN